jgi:hypothetical protein
LDVIQLVADETAKVPVVVFFRDDERVETVALHERLRPLAAVEVFLIGEGRFGRHHGLQLRKDEGGRIKDKRTNSIPRVSVIPAKLAIARASRNPVSVD